MNAARMVIRSLLFRKKFFAKRGGLSIKCSTMTEEEFIRSEVLSSVISNGPKTNDLFRFLSPRQVVLISELKQNFFISPNRKGPIWRLGLSKADSDNS